MISLRLYDRDGTTALGLLAEPIGFQISVEFSDLGALQFEYPVNGVNASQIAVMREIAITNETGTEFSNARYVISNINRDRLASTGTITVSARSLLWRFDTALAYPDGGILSGEVKRTFDTATAGTILKTLIDDAKNRGALSGIGYTFTNAADSNSMSWADTTDAEYQARQSILAVIRQLAELGLVEVQMNARSLKATRPDGIGSDLTITANPIILRDGFNLTQAPEQINADKLAAVALVEADEGQILERSNGATLATYGRLETSFTASGIDDPLVINELSDNFLSNVATPNRQLTVGLTMQVGAPQPLKDFTVGDYVFTATSAGLERVRVRQVTITMSGGNLTATATLGDRIYENEIRQTRRLAAITSGSVNIGNGSQPTSTPVVEFTPDSIAPAAPTGLAGSSTFYLEGSNPRARVLLIWTAPTLNEDGSALTDLGGYEVNLRRSSGDAWEFAGVVSNPTATLSGLEPSKSYQFKVIAVDAFNNKSVDSNTLTLTTATQTVFSTTPSTPTVSSRLGTISIIWNGLSNLGGSMPADFSYANVHASTTNNFSPTTSTIFGRINGADTFVMTTLPYGVDYYFKLVGYSTSGVASTASGQATAKATALVDTDVIGKVISGAKIVDGSITASDAIIGNTITGGLIQALAITAGKIDSNAITADKIDAGAVTAVKISSTAIDGKTITGSIVRTSSAASRVEMDSTGLFVYNAGTKVVSLNSNGTASFSGAISASTININNAFTVSALGKMVASGAEITGKIVATSGFIGSEDQGWNFTSNGTIRNADGTTILYPTSLSNSYAMISNRAISANGFQSSGTITTTGSAGISIGGEIFAGGRITAQGTSSNRCEFLNYNTVSLHSISSGYGVDSHWSPNSDNTYDLGLATGNPGNGATANRRWRRLYANNTTVTNSDGRLKTDIEVSPLGLEFIESLRPVRYRWKVGNQEVVKDEDGNGIVVGESPEGKPIFEMKESPGVRLHYGFIAQEVKQILDDSGIEDFAGWVQSDLSDPESTQSLSYEQFIAPLARAIQQLSAKVKALEESNG